MSKRVPQSDYLLALDPATHTGAALFARGTLLATALFSGARKSGSTVNASAALNSAHRIALQLQWWISDKFSAAIGPFPGEIAYEWPQIYQRGRGVSKKGKAKTKADPNDLLVPAAIATAAVLALPHAVQATPYLPAAWIGQLPKDPDRPADQSPRGQLIARNLTAPELSIARAQLQHDVWDAIGIGLFHLGRLKRHVNHFA